VHIGEVGRGLKLLFWSQIGGTSEPRPHAFMCCFASENAGRLLLRAGIVSFKPACPNCDLPRKQNGLVDRLRHQTAQSFASDVVGAEMLPSVNPAQSRLFRRR